MMKPPQAGNVSEPRVEHKHEDRRGRGNDRRPTYGLGSTSTQETQGVEAEEHSEEPWNRSDDQ